MIKIAIIGSGKVASHLVEKVLSAPDLFSVEVYARHPEKLKEKFSNLHVVSHAKELTLADLYLLAISDDSIEEVSHSLPLKNQLVVHMAGSRPIDILSSSNRKGVMYPIQSFSNNKPMDFEKLIFCVEAENEADYELLEQVVKALSSNSLRMNSEQRLTLHLSAVLVNNFVNHLYYLASELCAKANIPFELLQPLILETTQKIQKMTPYEAQTGPAVRNDAQVITNHVSALTNPDLAKIYQLLTESIQKTYGKKL